jgi:type IV pilus assembly protein PilC
MKAGLDITQYKKAAVKHNTSKTSNVPTSWLNKEITLSFNVFGDKVKEAFYMELSILIGAGVDIKAALELLCKQQKKNNVKVIITDIKDKIISGYSFSEAAKTTGYFTSYEYYSLRIGEESGKTTEILVELAAYYTKKLKQKRQIIQALSYPILVLGTSLGAVGFMLTFIVPMFSDVFKRFGGDLPYITKVIINLSKGLSDNILFILATLLAIGWAVWFMRRYEWYKKYSSNLLLSLPVVGGMMRRIYLAQMCGSFTLLLGAKVPLLQAIELVRQMISFYPIYTSLKEVEKDILTGLSLHESLEKFPVYDPRLVTLLKVGEEVNKLELFFQKLTTQYNEEVEYQASILSSVLEPFIIIFLGLVVGTVLVAMYLPLFELSTNIS